MTGASITVSIVIVSRGRADALRRCVLGVSQLRYPAFEVIVVTDAAGQSVLRPMPQAAHIRVIPFDEPNISAARNLGVSEAAGEVVAFIDDDAVPEPSWLGYLSEPFRDPDVAAAAGFVRGRNGISMQWRALAVDREGATFDLSVDEGVPTVLTPPPGQAIRTQGTNMAVRRSDLAALGGFDPAYRFFLDETDLNMRLSSAHRSTAIVPRAEVHHGFAPSARRSIERAPRDLFEIGASWAVFLRRHCPPERHAMVWARVEAQERVRALRHMVRGSLEPRDVRRLLSGLRAGYAEGQTRELAGLPPLPHAARGFQPFPAARSQRSVLISGRSWSARRLHDAAASEVAAGHIATVIRLSPTALFHQVAFTDSGYWLQRGGLFGKSERAQPLFSFWRFSRRIAAERARVADVRLLGKKSARNPTT